MVLLRIKSVFTVLVAFLLWVLSWLSFSQTIETPSSDESSSSHWEFLTKNFALVWEDFEQKAPQDQRSELLDLEAFMAQKELLPHHQFLVLSLYLGLGWVFLGDLELSKDVWSKALLSEESVSSSAELPKEALDQLDTPQIVVENSPYLTLLWYNLGNILFFQGFFPEAIEAYTQAIELKFDFAPAYLNRANAHLEILEQSQALEDYLIYHKLFSHIGGAQDVTFMIRELRKEELRAQQTQKNQITKADFLQSLSKEELLDLLKETLINEP